eukprot:759250-Hanusia_phi.AAC.7
MPGESPGRPPVPDPAPGPRLMPEWQPRPPRGSDAQGRSQPAAVPGDSEAPGSHESLGAAYYHIALLSSR